MLGLVSEFPCGGYPVGVCRGDEHGSGWDGTPHAAPTSTVPIIENWDGMSVFQVHFGVLTIWDNKGIGLRWVCFETGMIRRAFGNSHHVGHGVRLWWLG